VKFVFPNDENVYLHDTPAQGLFDRTRRDFSHGCVRVEHPEKLAEWVLQGQDGWTADRIADAMHATDTQRVNLKQPLRVVLSYMTASVVPQDGTVHFAQDIYKQDPKLDQALGQRASR
jgi:murein L,D-transpeptidase YcbB/YkuD